MRNPLGSWYHTQPGISASQLGLRLTGCSGTWFAVGHTDPPRNGSATVADALGGVDGRSVSSLVPRAVVATMTVTVATSTAVPPAASQTSHGRRRTSGAGLRGAAPLLDGGIVPWPVSTTVGA